MTAIDAASSDESLGAARAAAIPLLGWTERRWHFDLPVGVFPALLGRLAGLPARAADLVADADDRALSAAPVGGWSVKRHLAHLDDLHELDVTRVAQFRARAAVLSAADPENRRTSTADHDAALIDAILGRLRRRRGHLVRELGTVLAADVAAVARHPRLDREMRLIDWMELVADHDDHHLAHARRLLAVGRFGAAAPL